MKNYDLTTVDGIKQVYEETFLPLQVKEEWQAWLAMPDNGFGWETRAEPPSSDEFVEAQARYYHHTIECFGADCCMFESNFPVDRLSLFYHVLWNGLKKISAQYSEVDQTALFSGTASRVYKLA